MNFTIAVVFINLISFVGASRAAQIVESTGPANSVFSQERGACRRDDFPDAPARAFRDAAGRVHLFAANYQDHSYLGADLDAAKSDCTIVYEGADDNDPARFDDHSWLFSFWTSDGTNVAALAHTEFQAHRRPWLCPSGKYWDCWYNAVTAAVSHDGGFHFSRPPEAIVAAPRYRFDAALRHPTGFFQPSNIVEREGYFYVMVSAAGEGAQRRGICLLRTREPMDPTAWRGWDGSGFAVRLGNPYLRPAGELPQTCMPIDPAHLHSHIQSLVMHVPSGRYIALMSFEAGPAPGFYASDSSDLFHWSEPRMVMPRQEPAGACGDRPTRAYPSLLDPDSPSRNFDTVGNEAYLYFTRFHHPNCDARLDRDLMRVPVRIRER